MVEALAANRADDALHVGSLPRRARRRQNFLDSHGFHILAKLSAEDAVAVPQEVPRDLFKRECFAQLLPGPLGGGMRGHVEMHDPSSVVSQNQEHVQELKSDRRHAEEVDRHHGLDVILKEGPPGLRRRIPPAYQVLAHAGFTDIDAEFEQFTMDAGRAPKRILSAHLPNQLADFFRHRWAPGLAMTNFPGPEEPEALAVPANDGFGLDDDQGRSPIAPSFAQPRPEESIGGRRFR